MKPSLTAHPLTDQPLTDQQCQSARLARDARFDGHFYTAVKTTGIFCRPICPAVTAKEENVEYFANAAVALKAGYRPCLRCRPDSAPDSRAWQGTRTSVQRALTLIEQGALHEQSLTTLAERLGMTDRHLRNLFKQQIGMSPKTYATLTQLLFAKQLLHSSTLSIGDVAFASGFKSIRRFNDAFQKYLKLTPSEIRAPKLKTMKPNRLILAVREPFNWEYMLSFYQLRAITNIESVTENSYQRNFQSAKATGWFKATKTDIGKLEIEFQLSDMQSLRTLVATLHRMFDLDADIKTIEDHLNRTPLAGKLTSGLRIPGVWSPWEAGVRAILGQQVSIKAAITHLNRLVAHLNSETPDNWQFPSAKQLLAADLSILKMPESRRQTLAALARHVAQYGHDKPEDWLKLKGIGPWTINYARLRGLSQPDCFLSTDLIVKKAWATLPEAKDDCFSPWGSYATFHCWNLNL
jgi:AraC family transcriptional regulator of adaptative response / DNA-3-methyladenine glycosylase II